MLCVCLESLVYSLIVVKVACDIIAGVSLAVLLCALLFLQNIRRTCIIVTLFASSFQTTLSFVISDARISLEESPGFEIESAFERVLAQCQFSPVLGAG